MPNIIKDPKNNSAIGNSYRMFNIIASASQLQMLTKSHIVMFPSCLSLKLYLPIIMKVQLEQIILPH